MLGQGCVQIGDLAVQFGRGHEQFACLPEDAHPTEERGCNMSSLSLARQDLNLARSPDIQHRKARIDLETRLGEQRRADVAGEQREAALPVLLASAVDLFQRMHCEPARAVQPFALAGERVRSQQRVAVARGAVAEAGAFGQRARAQSSSRSNWASKSFACPLL